MKIPLTDELKRMPFSVSIDRNVLNLFTAECKKIRKSRSKVIQKLINEFLFNSLETKKN